MAQKKKAKGMTKLIQLPSSARRAVEIGRDGRVTPALSACRHPLHCRRVES